MLRKLFSYFTLPLLLLLSNSTGNSAPQLAGKSPEGETGTLEKLIVASGNVVMDFDLSRLARSRRPGPQTRRQSAVATTLLFTRRLPRLPAIGEPCPAPQGPLVP